MMPQQEAHRVAVQQSSSGGSGCASFGMYADMYRIRRAEEVIADLYPQQQMRCPVHLCIGQEAPPVGVCCQLELQDYVFSTHRSHGHYLGKGGSLVGLLGELYGRAVGCSGGKGGSMHLIDLDCNFLGAVPILGTSVALAVGAGFAISRKREQRVSVAFFGDAAAEEGVFYEAVNFAVVHRLPVILVCENNGLSTLSPLSVRQPPGRSLCDLVRGIGMAAFAGDGNDVLAVTALARQAIDHARRGEGPVFLEFSTHRWREHCGPGWDHDTGLRDPAELAVFRAHDPLELLRASMERAGEWNESEIAAIRRRIDAEVDAAVKTAQNSPYPDRGQLMADEYAC
jgi:pyruvate dehydrogenase E1 component alpha subunit